MHGLVLKKINIFFALLVSSMFLVGSIRGELSFERFFRLNNVRFILEKNVRDLEDQNQVLRDEITKIKKSPAYAKRVLKDKYHVREENEEIVFFPDEGGGND